MALWTHKSSEAKAGRLELQEMSVPPDLSNLKQSLSLKATATTKKKLVESLERCLT
jgi:hypothetical protein